MNIEEFKRKYIDIIISLFNKENKEKLIKKIDIILKKCQSRGEINLANVIEELGNPNFDFYDLYNKGAKKLVYKGLIIEEKKDKYNYYGEMLNQESINLIVNLISKMSENYHQQLFNNLLFNNELNNKLILIIKLLIFTMNNYYDDYNKLLISGNGVVDYKLILKTKQGSLYQTVPVNDFLYGLFVDGLHTEKQFDKYLTNGSYQLLCEDLDKIYVSDKIDNTIIKKVLITIANMFNNKIFYLEYYGIIDEKLKKTLIEKFNIIFNQTLQSFEIVFYQDDIIKIEEAMNKSINRINKEKCFS